MARAMALLYIGPLNAPDLHSDYHISPIFTPASLLFQFPPVYMSCGERDPFVDDVSLSLEVLISAATFLTNASPSLCFLRLLSSLGNLERLKKLED